MSVEVKYDGENPFDGLPVPFVERSIEYITNNSNTAAVERISLVGQVPPPDDTCDRFNYFINEQASILTFFSDSYKKFEVVEDGEVIISRENVQVESIDFSDSNYQSILEYSINLNVFRGDFMKYSGVSDVSNSIIYNEEKDKTLNITHSVSAKGVPDSGSISSSTALQKAKSFVESEISRQKIDVPPVFMSHEGASDDESPMTPTSTATAFLDIIKPILVSFNETINRLSGEYSVTKEYVSDLYFYSSGILRYSVDIEASPESYLVVNLSGTIRYEEDISGDENFNLLVDRYKGFDFFGAAKRLSGQADLNKVPINRSISKDENKNSISFNFSYDNNPNFATENGSETALSFDFSNDANFITIAIQGDIRARLGIKNKWEVASEAFADLDIFAEASSAYSSYLSNVLGYDTALMEKMPINSNIMSESVNYNKESGMISFSYQLDNFSQTPDNDIFKSFDFSVDLGHPTSSFMATKEYKGAWIVQDLAASDRGAKAISGSAIKKAGVSCAQATAGIVSFMNSQASSVLTETQRQISFDGISSFSFSFSWSTSDSVKMIGESSSGLAEITLVSGDLVDLS